MGEYAPRGAQQLGITLPPGEVICCSPLVSGMVLGSKKGTFEPFCQKLPTVILCTGDASGMIWAPQGSITVGCPKPPEFVICCSPLESGMARVSKKGQHGPKCRVLPTVSLCTGDASGMIWAPQGGTTRHSKITCERHNFYPLGQ